MSLGLRSIFVILVLLIAVPAASQDRASRRPPRPDVTLPDGPVRQIILKSCTGCHGIDEYGYYAMSRNDWDALIERMKVTPSGLISGAEITDADKALLLDWLEAEFGPGSEPFERRYVVREVTDESRLTDGEASALMDRACMTCHAQRGSLIAAGLDEEAWRSMLTAKIATGSRLLIDEVDPLIEWIARQN